MTSQVSTPDMAPAWSPEPERRTRTEMRSHQVLNRDGLTLHARSAQRYDRDILAAGVIEMLDALHIDQYVLVGHSLGGDFAAGIALRFSERVVALGLVDIGPELRAPGLRRVRELTMRTPETYDSPAEYRAWLQALHPFAPASELTTLANHTLEILWSIAQRASCSRASRSKSSRARAMRSCSTTRP